MNRSKKDITLMSLNEIKNSLREGKVTISVIGIGRIGLPTALSFANSGLPTTGVDVNTKLVSMIDSQKYPLKDEPGFDKIFHNVIKKKKFHAVTEISKVVPDSDVVILSLPTPMNNENIPDYSALISVGKNLNKLLSSKTLVIVESTVEPGFIENQLLVSIEGTENKLKSGVDFHLGVCPETANPGEILNDFKKLPRLVSAIDEKIIPIITEIYAHVFNVEIIPMPNCKTANAVKLTTNVFRDINIAFVNELALLFEKLGIDITTVIETAKRKYNFQPHFPGPGVGGPCLPVNSYQILNTSKNFNRDLLKIVQTARKINEYMPYHVIKLLADALNKVGKSVKNSTVTILGVSYKPNVRDIQLAPSGEIIKLLEQEKVNIKIFDPHFISTEIFSHKTENNLEDAVKGSDAVLLITGHREFRSINPDLFVDIMKSPVLVDCTGMIDPASAKKSGIIFRGIGRGGT